MSWPLPVARAPFSASDMRYKENYLWNCCILRQTLKMHFSTAWYHQPCFVERWTLLSVVLLMQVELFGRVFTDALPEFHLYPSKGSANTIFKIGGPDYLNSSRTRFRYGLLCGFHSSVSFPTLIFSSQNREPNIFTIRVWKSRIRIDSGFWSFDARRQLF